jgi:uncharacterized repeat protein (TIGR01451 family)
MRKVNLAGLLRPALICLVVAGWLAAIWSTAAAQGGPGDRPEPPPDVPGAPPDRAEPPPSGGSGGSSGGGPGGHHSEPSAFNPCLTVHGVAINWGYRNEPGLPIDLSGSSWQTQKMTDDNGYYASDCLRFGIALVNPVSPPWLQPMTSDVAIRLGYRPSFEVNLGLYGGEVAPTMDVTPLMTASTGSARPGQTVSYTIRVANTPGGSQQTMGQVMVTDLLPDTLTPVTARSTQGELEWWGHLLTVDVGELPPGQGVTIIVTARVQGDAPPETVISNRASLLYTGHVASQTPTVEVVVQEPLFQLLKRL